MMLACGVTVLCLPSPRPCHPHQPPCSRLYPELGLHALRAPCGQESGLDCGQGQGEGVEGNDSIVENQRASSPSRSVLFPVGLPVWVVGR